MDELKTWWEIAQLAGAGAAVVLGPVAILLWRRSERDVQYIREADKGTLRVLSELTKTLDNRASLLTSQHKELVDVIRAQTETIKHHVEKTCKT